MLPANLAATGEAAPPNTFTIIMTIIGVGSVFIAVMAPMLVVMVFEAIAKVVVARYRGFTGRLKSAAVYLHLKRP